MWAAGGDESQRKQFSPHYAPQSLSDLGVLVLKGLRSLRLAVDASRTTKIKKVPTAKINQ